jgi:hypothetical protein
MSESRKEPSTKPPAPLVSAAHARSPFNIILSGIWIVLIGYRFLMKHPKNLMLKSRANLEYNKNAAKFPTFRVKDS